MSTDAPALSIFYAGAMPHLSTAPIEQDDAFATKFRPDFHPLPNGPAEEKEHAGKPFRVLGPVDPESYDAFEVGRMWLVRIVDGPIIEAYQDEVEDPEQLALRPSQRYPLGAKVYVADYIEDEGPLYCTGEVVAHTGGNGWPIVLMENRNPEHERIVCDPEHPTNPTPVLGFTDDYALQQPALRDLDTGGMSGQHYIDTGRYLSEDEVRQAERDNEEARKGW